MVVFQEVAHEVLRPALRAKDQSQDKGVVYAPEERVRKVEHEEARVREGWNEGKDGCICDNKSYHEIGGAR